MLQFQEGAKSNRFAQEIKARKRSMENDGIEPYRSHRKQLAEDTVLKPIPQYEQANINMEPQKMKLNRQYLTEPALAGLSQSKKKPERFKYDLNKLAQSITNEQPSSKFPPKPINLQNRIPVSKFCTSIKKCSKAQDQPLTINRYQRNEVKSIIFDSKVQPFDSRYSTPNPKDIEMQNNREIHLFKEKVDRVNNQIAAGISNLEKMIERLKEKKVNDSIMKAKFTMVKLETPAVPKPMSHESKIEIVEGSAEIQPSKKGTFFRKKQSPLLAKQEQQPKDSEPTAPRQNKRQQLAPSESHSQLAGDLKSKMGKFPPEFTSFVNRLATQIQIDMQFTNMVSELSKNGQLAKTKDFILNEIKKYQPEVEIVESFFQIEPAEIDPLELTKPYFILKSKEEDLSEQAMKIFNKYKDIQVHFDTKLRNKFEPAIIKLLFEDLAKFNSNKVLDDSKAVTTGHLLSYLNMRTNKSFRNRYFVKMAKRLELKFNTGLTIDSFNKLTLL